MTGSMARREFVQSGAAAAVLAGTATLMPTPWSEAHAEEADKLFEGGVDTQAPLTDAAFTADVVVVGAGAAGLAAAAEAVAQGMNVVLLEATGTAGGTTQFAEGILGVNTPIQQTLGIQNDIPTMVAKEMEFSNYCADSRLIKDFLEAADENIAWLQDLGVEFYDTTVGGTTQILYVGQGRQMTDKLAEHIEAQGAAVLYDTTAKRLIMQEGKVAGIVAESPDGEIVIATPAVVLACGGYIQNDAMVDALQRFSHMRVRYTANPGHNGEQLTMAYSAGADRSGITLMHFIWACTDGLNLHSELSTAFCNEGYFWVDNRGQRFCDESLTTLPSCIDNIILNQKSAYAILTDAEIGRLATEGCTVGWGSYIFAGSKMENLVAEAAAAVEEMPEGFFYAETIEGLAEMLGMDAATLTETVEEYNAMVAAGADTDYGKQAPFLHEVPSEGPFYAVELKCSAFCTMGGIRVNRANEVLDVDFNGIPGLYCAGVDCSGLQGTTYCILLGGGAQGYAVYSGRNAVRNAKKYLEEK